MFNQKSVPATKKAQYQAIINDMQHLLMASDPVVTSLSNMSALLNYYMTDVNWVGFYMFDGDVLTLGPFQGLPACTLIHLGSGVCGVSAKEEKILIVDDVDQFDGHIACDSHSKSEIVVPIVIDNTLFGVLDVDAPVVNRFDETDKQYLEIIINKLIDIL